jgi:MFS family permease
MPFRLPENLAVLRDRDYRLLFAGQAASLLGDGMVSVALAFAALELGGSVSDVGLVLAARMVPLVACLLVGGVVADRVSRRGVMVAADCVRGLSQGTMAALLISGSAEVWMLAALAGVTGAGTGFFNPASTGLLPSVVAPERLQQANGLRGTAQATGEIAGPAIAGVLVATAGAGWAIAIDAATFAISAVMLAALRVRPRDARASTRFLRDLRDGWTAFTARTWVWAFVAGAAFGNLCWGAWSALGPVIADRDLGGATAWGRPCRPWAPEGWWAASWRSGWRPGGRCCSPAPSGPCSPCRSRSWRWARRWPCSRRRRSPRAWRSCSPTPSGSRRSSATCRPSRSHE